MTDIINATPEEVKDLQKNYWTYFAFQSIGMVCLLANVYLNSQISIVNELSVQVSMSWLSIIVLTLNAGLVFWFSKLKSDAHLEVYTHLLVKHLKSIARKRIEQDNEETK